MDDKTAELLEQIAWKLENYLDGREYTSKFDKMVIRNFWSDLCANQKPDNLEYLVKVFDEQTDKNKVNGGGRNNG